ncbi:MAG: DNA polymerase I [Candidatus Binataceae bacterium]|jgi:DNA polymerase-1
MPDQRSTLYLVDGSGYIYRAFYALPRLTTSRGTPTNAVYGFIRMLVKLLKDARPSHVAVVFDSPKKGFRDELFESYKATRAATPNDLIVQIPFIHRMVEAFRIKSLTIDGYEADDVIATLALRAAREKFSVVIVTADKDFMQLVSPAITLWDTMRDKRTGVREVRERFGVEPRALVDVMALMGDAIDNVKGVPGVGEKTASALIAKFGSLDELLANPDRLEQSDIRGAKKLGALIAAHREDAMLARRLVKLATEVPLEVSPAELAYRGIDEKAAAELMRELEFTSLIRELAPSEVKLPQAEGTEIAVNSDDIAAVIETIRGAPRIAFNLGGDSDGAGALKLKGENDARTFAIESALISATAELLAAPSPPKACHDLKSHLNRLRRFGVTLGGVDFDTMLAGFLVNPGRAEPSLDDLYHEHLAPLGGRAAGGSEPQLVETLREVLQPRLEEHELGPLFRDIELPIAAVLAEMEAAGIGIDGEALKSMSIEFSEQLSRLEHECFELAGKEFNLNSPIQLREVLFTDLKLPTKGLKKTKSGFSTDADVLTKLAASHPMPRKLLEYRGLAKLKSTYADALPALINPATGRIHTSFHQALTATGRLSSTDPNLQNIPTRSEEGRRIRRAFVAKPGWLLLSADYSQIELRVLAHLSGDPTLIDAFSRGEDIHTRTATEVLGIKADAVDAEARRLAKVINFGIIYGMGPQRLAGELGISLREASDYIRRYFERLPGVSKYLDQTLNQAREQGYVTTMFGRRRYLPELNAAEGGARSQAERIAVNTPLQGTAADLIKIAMVRLHRLIGHEASKPQMLLQVHDELLFEVGEHEAKTFSGLVKSEMEAVAPMLVPLVVEVKAGPNWAEMNLRF